MFNLPSLCAKLKPHFVFIFSLIIQFLQCIPLPCCLFSYIPHSDIRSFTHSSNIASPISCFNPKSVIPLFSFISIIVFSLMVPYFIMFPGLMFSSFLQIFNSPFCYSEDILQLISLLSLDFARNSITFVYCVPLSRIFLLYST